jgi:pimeloyl-ACP methyl ester carboxylesterase
MADSYDTLQHDSDVLELDYQVYQGVWGDAEKLRRGGKLLKLGKQIQCPVVAIHGDYDPHPAEGVYIPLSSALGDFRFILLEKCGHCPWYEKNARENFFDILKKELEF